MKNEIRNLKKRWIPGFTNIGKTQKLKKVVYMSEYIVVLKHNYKIIDFLSTVNSIINALVHASMGC